jgi:hypothetical protein
MRKALVSVLFAVLVSVAALSQAPPTNAPQFTFTENFFSGSVYGVSQAMGAAVTTQLTTNSQLRLDQITIPSVGYTGELFGPQYNLCGISAIEKLLAPTTFNCGNLSIYAAGELGYGRIQVGGGPALHGLPFRIDASVNYTLASHVALNVVEFGYCDMGVTQAGQSKAGWCGQSGISFLFGNNAAATAAKAARVNRAAAKKLQKLNAAIAKAQKS